MIELLEKILQLNEDGAGIRALYKIYHGLERGIDPDKADLFTALDMMKGYYIEYLDWYEQVQRKSDLFRYLREKPVRLAYTKRLEEIERALRSRDEKEMLVALDLAVDKWHIDFPAIYHIKMGIEDDPKLEKIVDDIEEILIRLGKLPKESPYTGIHKIVKESSIDFPRETLDLSVWNKKGDIYTIKPEVKGKILEIIKRYPDKDLLSVVAKGRDDQLTIYIMGSICTNQYVDDSDVDVHLQVSKKSSLYNDLEFQKNVSKWFFDRKNLEKIDSFVGKHPVELYIQYRFVRPQIDSCYDLLRDIWLVKPKIVSLDFDPYDEYSDILDDVRSIVSNVDELLGELKRDVIDYEVIQEALKNLPKEYREPLLKKLKSKLQEIEDDILGLGRERHQWSVTRDKASAKLSKGTKASAKEIEDWEEANAIFKFAVRYKCVKIIKELEKLIEDDEITSDEVSKVKSILGV